MDLHTYASVVEDNYQRLAGLLLSPDADALKAQRLLALDLLPAPPVPCGYAIWSEGLLAEAFACFPTAASQPYGTACAPLLGLARTSAAFDLLLELMVAPKAETRRKALASLAAFTSEDTLRVSRQLCVC
jgi:hypothetical protein